MKSKHPTLGLKEVGGRNIFLEIPAILDANFGRTYSWSSPRDLVDHPDWSAQESELSVFEGSGNSSRTPRKNNLKKTYEIISSAEEGRLDNTIRYTHHPSVQPLLTYMKLELPAIPEGSRRVE